MKKIKVAIIHNIIAPYRIPLFNAIAKDKNIDLTVLFMSESAHDRKWNTDLYLSKIKFKYKILPHIKLFIPLKQKIEYIVNFSIIKELLTQHYDVVITAGWLDFSCQMTYLLKNIGGYKYIVWSESTENEKSIQRTITLPFVRWVIKRASGYIAIGTRSKQYLLSLGAREKDISVAISTVDVDFFRKNSRLTNRERLKIRKKYLIPADHKVILYVGQFIYRKGVDILLEAFSRMNKENISLVLVGYGPEKEIYRQIICDKLIKNVNFIDHLEVEDLPKVYGMSDLFVLPSREETWGLVVNEAIACGLPVVVSDAVGCVDDLVIKYNAGQVFTKNNTNSLLKRINIILYIKKIKSSLIINKMQPKFVGKSFIKVIYSV